LAISFNRNTFAQLLKQNSEKKIQIDDKEKNAWVKMDRLVVDCENMVAQVKKKTKEQVNSSYVELSSYISEMPLLVFNTGTLYRGLAPITPLA